MPRAKKSKAYRKLMEEFSMGFGFRVPYQVLVDADFIAEANKCKMDLVRRLETTLHGEVKPMITQCSMRHLYERKSEPGVEAAIEQAKTQFERRRCGHHPDEYPEPLSALECIKSVVDLKGNAVNKHRYVCAINDDDVRANIRQVAGTPLVYIRRSVMIMEPMATVSTAIRAKDEKNKFRAELKPSAGKRKRDDDGDQVEKDEQVTANAAEDEQPKKKKKNYGPKQPNPLAVKKKKSKSESDEQESKAPKANEAVATEATEVTESTQTKAPKKSGRRRIRGRDKAKKYKAAAAAAAAAATEGATAEGAIAASNDTNTE
ncbi:Fcf1-domain-containing protein [Annulohypoxylon moriforme]|nr:Fcf1-domain-containing protein [Annulohypoxylon moriforme]